MVDKVLGQLSYSIRPVHGSGACDISLAAEQRCIQVTDPMGAESELLARPSGQFLQRH
jgi:hypothetical protein